MTTRRAHQTTFILATAIMGCTSGTSDRPVQAARTAGASSLCRSATKLSPFELVVLGSGGPHSVGRAASSYLIVAEGVPRIVVDVGPGAFVRLGELGVDLTPVDTVLLTHLHIDHAGDLPGFVKSRDLGSSDALTFRIFGPDGGGAYPSTIVFIDKLFGATGAFAYLRGFRNDLNLTVTDLPTAQDAPIHEVLAGDLHVTSIAVDHADVPAVAFRIEHAGHAVVISGDLASKNDNLARLATGADLLVYDAAVLDPPGSPKPLYDFHTAPHRIGEVATAARVRSLLLSHVFFAAGDTDASILSSVRSSFAGETRFAEDCMRVDISH